MSQHVFFFSKATGFYAVLMGWDRPLQYYFMTVYKNQNDDTPFFSNLDIEPEHYSMQYYEAVLAQHKLSLPQGYLDSVTMDGVRNLGNKEVTHWLTDSGVHCQQAGIDWGIL